jgi:diguanylate cyclase (GGDEF)-like protein
LLIDLDNFKAFNDRFGHAAGNRVLHAVAKPMKDVLRGSDVVARYGGEEFAIILQDMDKKTALSVARRLLSEIRRLRVEDEEHGALSIRCSIGLASFPDDAQEMDDLFFAADRALYLAKSKGKNRVSTA